VPTGWIPSAREGWGGYGRRTVEQTRVIDVGTLQRAGYVGRPARNWWKWRDKAFSLGIWPKSWCDGFIHLPNQILCMEHVPWRFGGQRYYFVCDCGRRVEKLHAFRDHPWRCRRCYGLTYATRRVITRHRLLMKAQKIREQLGGSRSLLDQFPTRPKGMHWNRYEGLRRQHDTATKPALSMTAAYLVGLRGRR
jgi:hypothetical protein